MSTLQQIALFPEIHQPGEVVLPPDRSNSVDTARKSPDNPAVTKRAPISEATRSNSGGQQTDRAIQPPRKVMGARNPRQSPSLEVI